MFLSKTDLYVTILEDELAEITRNDDVLISNAISSAIAEMKVYLHDSYDTDAIFSASGQQRHGLLVNLGADMAVYFIVARCQAGQELADREARYKRAVKLLKSFESSETYADLPRRPQRAQKQIWFTSNRKRVNYFGGADDMIAPSQQVQQTSLPTIQIQRDIVPVVAPTNTIVGTHIYMVSKNYGASQIATMPLPSPRDFDAPVRTIAEKIEP